MTRCKERRRLFCTAGLKTNNFIILSGDHQSQRVCTTNLRWYPRSDFLFFFKFQIVRCCINKHKIHLLHSCFFHYFKRNGRINCCKYKLKHLKKLLHLLLFNPQVRLGGIRDLRKIKVNDTGLESLSDSFLWCRLKLSPVSSHSVC